MIIAVTSMIMFKSTYVEVASHHKSCSTILQRSQPTQEIKTLEISKPHGPRNSMNLKKIIDDHSI